MKTVTDHLTIGAEQKERWIRQIRLLTGGQDPKDAVFMDIETTGFNRTYDTVYLVGYLYYEGGEFFLEQHLIESVREEPSLVEAFCEKLKGFKTIITFNGDMFDLPFMENRHHLLHVIAAFPSLVSIDLYRRYRPYVKTFGWENGKLKTIERFLGIYREDVFSGGELIEVFEEYALNGDERLEKTLLLHNYEDILNMPNLLLVQEYVTDLTTAGIEDVLLERENEHFMTLRVVCDRLMPLSYEGECALCKNREETIRFRTEAASPVWFLYVPLVEGMFYYYLPDPENYYYLPDSDSIIHRSMADTLGDIKKKKATAKNCRIPRTGVFLIARAPEEGVAAPGLHLFREENAGRKDPVVFYDKTELVQTLESADRKTKEQWIRTLFKL